MTWSIGILTFALLGGIIADRVAGKRILLTVETVNFLTVSTTAFLSLSGLIELWHLAVAGLIMGSVAAFFYPAYTAILPKILRPELLLSANAVEGGARPVLHQALGPAIAGILVAAYSPGLAIAVMGICHLVAIVTLTMLSLNEDKVSSPSGAQALNQMGQASTAIVQSKQTEGEKLPTVTVLGLIRTQVKSVLHDQGEAIKYLRSTMWLKWSLVSAIMWVLLLTGPIEVLLPFVVSRQLGGNAETFGYVLAGFGIGSALGATIMGMCPLPRRYLTFMMMMWGPGTLPLVAIGFVSHFWVLVALVFCCGMTGGMGGVIWGTLLQLRVPQEMLGRISSLDFFVSLLFMPVSMALAGPLSLIMPIWAIFAFATIVAIVAGVGAWLVGGMIKDEAAHPLDYKLSN